MVVTGDPTQVDLPPGSRSGLADALEALRGVEDVAVVRFTEKDVVRHPLVARIVGAYEARDRAARGDDPPGDDATQASRVARACPRRRADLASRTVTTTRSWPIDLVSACEAVRSVEISSIATACLLRCRGAGRARRVPRWLVRRAAAGAPLILGLILTDDAEQRRLNRTYRGSDAPTNVLVLRARRSGGSRRRRARRCCSAMSCSRFATVAARSEGAAQAARRPSAPPRRPWRAASARLRPSGRRRGRRAWRRARSRYCRVWGCRILIAILCEQADPDTLHR